MRDPLPLFPPSDVLSQLFIALISSVLKAIQLEVPQQQPEVKQKAGNMSQEVSLTSIPNCEECFIRELVQATARCR